MTAEEEIVSFLLQAGCCNCCIKIFARKLFYDKGESFLESILAKDEDNLASQNTLSLNKQLTFKFSKKQRNVICVSCLGLLQANFLEQSFEQLSDALLKRNYDATSFSLNISLPICLKLRIYLLWLHLEGKFSLKIEENPAKNLISLIKESWKNKVGPQVAVATNKECVPTFSSNLYLNVVCHYDADEEECSPLEKIYSTEFATRRTQIRKYSNKVLTHNFLDEALLKCSDRTFRDVFKDIPTEPIIALAIKTIESNHASIYFAGRYNKYSRELPQTPWFVDGERRMPSSVQELFAPHILNLSKGKDVKFSASGREDVDVRCLGNGRPFVLEILNPCHVNLLPGEIATCQKEINASTSDIKIIDLQLVSRSETSNLKDGEQEKTKSYCAFCYVKNGLKAEDLLPIQNVSNLTLKQMTPLRVLHRRPLAQRERKVIFMDAVYVEHNFFKIYLTTEAGTYIKEFVHGDFGRTIPNLRSLLGIEVDIVALDVTDVQLDWPSSIK